MTYDLRTVLGTWYLVLVPLQIRTPSTEQVEAKAWREERGGRWQVARGTWHAIVNSRDSRSIKHQTSKFPEILRSSVVRC